MKLCLGTVQFGMDYGIYNQSKKDPEYCLKCFDYATQNGITAIDTATAYGIAEQITGEFLAKKTVSREKLFISTKLLPNILDDYNPDKYVQIIRENIQQSLKTLNTEYIDAYLLHSSRYAFCPEILEALQEIKKEGLTKHVGVSVYYPDEAMACLESSYVDYMQAPYSLFDHRMKETGIFEKIAERQVMMDIRTVFTKGLIRLDVDKVPEYLSRAKSLLEKLDNLCKKTGYSRIELAMGYVKSEEDINHLVFGVRDLGQLKEDILAFEKDIPEDVIEEIEKAFSNVDADIVIPSLWKK